MASAVGGWYGAGLDRDNPPIVGLGSEGDYELLAPSLDGLLAKLTSQQFGKAWSDLKPHDEVECQTVELAQWLAAQPAGDKAACDDGAAELPDFRGFMEKWSRDREDYWANHRLMAELGWRLAAHLPKGKNAWDKTHFEVAIVGKQYEARVLSRGPQPFEEAASIEIPAARSARGHAQGPARARAMVRDEIRPLRRRSRYAEFRIRCAPDHRRRAGAAVRGKSRSRARA
ncbi:hypothetical protein ACQ86E_31920 [Bradyrhizobium betae]|uniref:hypothetical protein n=1 Tax=Bradyrhizobium betae TaxID=244734 RepID=UPI003D66AE87